MKEIKDIFPDYHDGEFLAPKSGAKLASLFNPSHAEPEGNESFKFTAPKQPKKVLSASGPHPQQQAPPSPAPVVLLAFAVHAFHFVNGQYVKHGKLGVAILGNHPNKEYKVLLYASQQKHITTARIHHGFVLTVQPGNYTAFYDDQRQSWSLRFDSEEARIDFCKEVCVARWNSQTFRDTLLTQDLAHGEGRTVSMGDTVEVVLSSWLLQNHAIGQLFDSSSCKEKLQRVSLTSNSALMGWEKGLLGMQKGGRRLIIVPPIMGYESKEVPNHVPPSSALVIAVEVHQVHFSKDADSLAAGSTDFYKSLVPDLDRINVERNQAPGVKCRDVNELPKLPEADKAKLISRVAKMGQPTLPFLKVPAQPSDSVMEERRETLSVGGSSAQAVSSPLPVAVFLNPPVVQYPEAVSTRTAQDVHVRSDRAFQPYPASQLHPYPLTFPLQHAPYLTEIGSFMMTEARQNNTEIRLAVARVTDKVDYLASKVDDLCKQGVCSSAPSSGSLETGMILQNIQRIIQENASLKKGVLEKGSRVEEHDCKTGEFTEQRYVEKNLLLDQTNDHLQSKLLQAEQEKVHLAGELDASSSRVCKLQQEADDLQQRVTELHAKLSAVLQESQNRCALMSSLEAKVEELKKEVVQSQQKWREEKQKCRKMEWTMTIREEEIQDLRAENDSLNQLLSDRRRKWQQERERFLLQLEEQRNSNEQEQQQLLDKLRKARVYAGTHSRTQVEPEWQEKCDAALDGQKSKLEEVISQLQKQNTNLQEELESERQQFEAQLAVQLKWVMNGLFRALRAEFDQQESYSGEFVLNVVLSTIKHVTMRFLKELKSEEQEEYFSEEKTPSGRMEERGIKSEEIDSPKSVDSTYVTAYETNSLEASEVSTDFSLASDVQKEPAIEGFVNNI
ncbi:FK506-binding protein 15 isoform 1-T1 [Clarias gariepinus]